MPIRNPPQRILNDQDETFMLRCLEIAKNGLGTTAPNPMVGCVIVHDGCIIGEGFTSAYGGPHAEVNAINSVQDKTLLREASLYVTLEPCSHYGKTPPCANLIIHHKIPEVVIALQDPHQKVAGKGIQKLIDSGCKVAIGILEKECREHHKRFLTFHEKRRPYIILKWAQTLDGFIAPANGKRSNDPKPYWITNTLSRQRVHQWRSQEQAILVGTNTVLEDNPKLDVRHWKGKNPIRIVIDKALRIKGHYHVLDGSVPTLVITQQANAAAYQKGIDYVVLDWSENIAAALCAALYERQINSVLVEGGTQTLHHFIEAGLWDEARVFIGAETFKQGLEAPRFSGRPSATQKIGQDTLNYFRND
ncbi:MAG: bifunctional diaminohydroxyphosphoribosylaminopyrimidine deaminase/5-amino-6-(5-phosphoribosylamino)uracil reductase RibD [Flavobacteriaceae bacterium]